MNQQFRNTATPIERILLSVQRIEQLLDEWNIPRADHINDAVDRIEARAEFITNSRQLNELAELMAALREARHA
jgi:hypothetical protein